MSLSEVSEIRKCNNCGHRWEDDGSWKCPHCKSEDTENIRED